SSSRTRTNCRNGIRATSSRRRASRRSKRCAEFRASGVRAMARLRLFQVDAFTSRVFGGNPAAVVPLPAWLDDGLMQRIAAENNLAETAFFVPGRTRRGLRWFTPEAEVKLCGHATLASAYTIFTELEPGLDEVRFDTLSGELIVRRGGDDLIMDFPGWAVEEVC